MDLIGIKNQTAWYEEKAKALQEINGKMLAPFIAELVAETIYDMALCKVAINMLEDAFIDATFSPELFGKVINELGRERAWFPLEMKKENAPPNEPRVFTGILKYKK